MYYPSGENKGADQLRSYCEADLRLCFRLRRLLVFPWGGSNVIASYFYLSPAKLGIISQSVNIKMHHSVQWISARK